MATMKIDQQTLSGTTPSLSIVVSTRNRVDRLERCVEAFKAIVTEHAWELVIVDNKSDDGTNRYLSTLEESWSNGATVIRLFERKAGCSAARNLGWRVARAPLVAFTDDDCYVATDYVDRVLEVFRDSPDIGFLGGRVLLYDPTDYWITVQDADWTYRFEPYTFVWAGLLQGANMACTRALLERLNGFDERFGAGTRFPAEDVDLAAAAVWTGAPGVYDPRPVVYHHHGRKSQAEADRLMESYDAGRGAYYAKYVLNPRSRAVYRRFWLASIAKEIRCTWKNRDFGLTQSRRELISALKYWTQLTRL